MCDTLRDIPPPVAKARIMGSITTGSSWKAVVTAADEHDRVIESRGAGTRTVTEGFSAAA